VQKNQIKTLPERSAINALPKETLLHIIEQVFFLAEPPDLPEHTLRYILFNLFSNDGQEGIIDPIIHPFQKKQFRATVFFIHDIDWISIQHPYSLFKYLRSLVSPPHKWYSLGQLLQRDFLLKNIEQLLLFEKNKNISSLFFLGSSKKWHSFGRRDIRYTNDSFLLTELISLLKNQAIEIGLHSSFGKNNHYLLEKENLEKLTNQKIHTHSSHYMNNNRLTFPSELEYAGLKYDFSSGNTKTVSYVNSTAQMHKSVDPSNMHICEVYKIPLILMDNVFFKQPSHNILETLKRKIDHATQYDGSISILFHPENMALRPILWECYDTIIDICLQQGAIINPKLNYPKHSDVL
jgi:hypothetical protein